MQQFLQQFITLHSIQEQVSNFQYYLLSGNLQLKEVKQQLRNNELTARRRSNIDENSFSLFEEMNRFIQKWIIEEYDDEEINVEQVTQLFQEWNE